MKRTTVCLVTIGFASVGLPWVFAGSAGTRGGGSQTDSDMFGLPTQFQSMHSGPVVNGGQSGGSSVAGASGASLGGNGSSNEIVSSNSNVSSSGSTSAGGSASSTQSNSSNRLSDRNPNGSSTATARGVEKVIDTGEKGKETQTISTAKAVSEGDKIFGPSLLDKAVSSISDLGHQKETDRSASHEDARLKSSGEKVETVKEKAEPQKNE